MTQLVELVNGYRDGKSTTKLAANYGLSPKTVARRLRAAGVELRPSGGRWCSWKLLDDGLMARRYLEGESTTQLAARFGVSAPTIARHLKAAGVELRPPGYPWRPLLPPSTEGVAMRQD